MPDNSFEDRFLIREVYGRYALAAAQQDGDAWLACWSKDGNWITPHFEVYGHEALGESFAGTWTMFASVAAFNEVGAIKVDRDSATAVSAVYEVMTLKSGDVVKMAGLYTDTFVREDGAWRFSKRGYQLISHEGPSLG